MNASRNVTRVSSSAVMARNAARLSRLPVTAEGSGMLQWTVRGHQGTSGQTSRTLSHRLITQSKRWPMNSSRCFGSWAAGSTRS